jgi:ParB family chromosome partitioning protein
MSKKKPSLAPKLERAFREEGELDDTLFDVTTTRGLINISLERLVPNPNQPRKTFYDQTIQELADSIREQGILSPILVRPQGEKFQVVAGERRYQAAKLAGLKDVPALIRRVSDDEAKILSLIENIQREDLNDIDRAAALRELKVNLGLPWEQLAKKLGLTKQRVLDLVGLLDLPEEIREEIRQKRLTEKHGRALRLLLDQAEVLRDMFEFLKKQKLTGEDCLELVRFVKGKPGFTIEESYNQWRQAGSKKEKIKIERHPAEIAILEGSRLAKTLEKIKVEDLLGERREELRQALVEVQKKIRALLTYLKDL